MRIYVYIWFSVCVVVYKSFSENKACLSYFPLLANTFPRVHDIRCCCITNITIPRTKDIDHQYNKCAWKKYFFRSITLLSLWALLYSSLHSGRLLISCAFCLQIVSQLQKIIHWGARLWRTAVRDCTLSLHYKGGSVLATEASATESCGVLDFCTCPVCTRSDSPR